MVNKFEIRSKKKKTLVIGNWEEKNYGNQSKYIKSHLEHF